MIRRHFFKSEFCIVVCCLVASRSFKVSKGQNTDVCSALVLWPPQWPAHSPHVTFISSANKESCHYVYSQLAHCCAIQTVSEVREGTIVRENSENDGGGGWQCVTKPKIWTIPIPILFSDTNFFRYRYRYFLRYQNFTKPIPILFSIPKLFETDTFFHTKFFRNQYRYFLKPKIFETDTDTIPTIGIVSNPRSFRNRNVTLWY